MQSTGRPAKSTTAITHKLQREHIRLTQIQDIAGCRVIVDDIAEQDTVTEELQELFPSADVIDRRKSPSHGYRAIHVVVSVDGKLIEIQVRTALQHLWAELSEKFSDVVEPAIKYGGGDHETQLLLRDAAALVERTESIEARPLRMGLTSPDLAGRRELADLKAEIKQSFLRLIAVLEKNEQE